ncbi:hypothetical protein [Rarobacter incanus]|uniref:Uncharacterized protein n=1 Tax=Rarobacter incanus TaxID=153494 RepID=A0A542SP38_9MICO|nr:hypothetical protein [Rarobacter incanus]TQK76352.1 hypothetical protein FB389_1022 [Rarobacter incanus]
MGTAMAIFSTVAPSIGVGAIFFFVIRAVMRADRREREYLRELDRLEEEKANSESRDSHPES